MSSTLQTSTFEFAPYKSLDNETLSRRIEKVRQQLGPGLLILGHHYQQDEVIAHSDLRGDSYQLSQMAAANRECRAIVFCGVHFMAETADILANRPESLAKRDGHQCIIDTAAVRQETGNCRGRNPASSSGKNHTNPNAVKHIQLGERIGIGTNPEISAMSK